MKRTLYITIILFVLAMLSPSLLRGQEIITSEPVRYHDTTWYDKGFDLYIGGGAFFANKQNALYYNGSSLNECNLDYIFSNQYWYEEIQREVSNQYNSVSITDEISYREEDLDWNVRYKIKTMLHLGARYKFGHNWGLSLSYSFCRLTTSSRFLLDYTSVSGNLVDAPVMEIHGKEDRSMIDLSASYLISQLNPIAKPFVEVGAQFNFCKAKILEAAIGDRTWTMLDPYNGEHYVPGAQMTTYDVVYGGAGYGISFAAGLKIVVNKSVSIDPTFYGCMASYGIKPLQERAFNFNYGVVVRLVVNDFFLGRNR
ncbi:MAG: hypothetical protein J5741_05365 [Bacteroidales bacterium]|nr:hypothetical protein [Bacteroidales bacterium]